MLAADHQQEVAYEIQHAMQDYIEELLALDA